MGYGANKKIICDFIKDHNLETKIKVIGFQKNPYPFIKKADVFVLSSLYEGLPNVLLEALTLKKFVISSNCPTGPKEILNYGKNGLIFESNNSQDFIEKMIKFDQLSVDDLQLLKINAKKKSKEFSIFNHFKNFKKILN